VQRPPIHFLVVALLFLLTVPLLLVGRADRLAVGSWLVPCTMFLAACAVGLRQRWRCFRRALWWASLVPVVVLALLIYVVIEGEWWHALWAFMSAPFWIALFLALSGAASFVGWWWRQRPLIADSSTAHRRRTAPRPRIRAIQVAAVVLHAGALTWAIATFGPRWVLLGLAALVVLLGAMTALGVLRRRRPAFARHPPRGSGIPG
jgi:hypothetical protein